MINPDLQISSLKWRFVIIGFLSILLWTNTQDKYFTIIFVILTWILALASVGGLTSLKSILYARFNYKDQKELK